LKKNYEKYAEVFKALGDSHRLKILDMLCKDERCACRILEKFDITQPTLSHHMKILCDCGMVNKRKNGKWMYYSINIKGCEEIIRSIENLTTIIGTECPINNKECCK